MSFVLFVVNSIFFSPKEVRMDANPVDNNPLAPGTPFVCSWSGGGYWLMDVHLTDSP